MRGSGSGGTSSAQYSNFCADGVLEKTARTAKNHCEETLHSGFP